MKSHTVLIELKEAKESFEIDCSAETKLVEILEMIYDGQYFKFLDFLLLVTLMLVNHADLSIKKNSTRNAICLFFLLYKMIQRN